MISRGCSSLPLPKKIMKKKMPTAAFYIISACCIGERKKCSLCTFFPLSFPSPTCYAIEPLARLTFRVRSTQIMVLKSCCGENHPLLFASRTNRCLEIMRSEGPFQPPKDPDFIILIYNLILSYIF